eukprot:m.77457 g.77457  ORF g.77457 m.77457 type:complete len:301 (+) comp11917_c0_seq1:217-1119(+)
MLFYSPLHATATTTTSTTISNNSNTNSSGFSQHFHNHDDAVMLVERAPPHHQQQHHQQQHQQQQQPQLCSSISVGNNQSSSSSASTLHKQDHCSEKRGQVLRPLSVTALEFPHHHVNHPHQIHTQDHLQQTQPTQTEQNEQTEQTEQQQQPLVSEDGGINVLSHEEGLGRRLSPCPDNHGIGEQHRPVVIASDEHPIISMVPPQQLQHPSPSPPTNFSHWERMEETQSSFSPCSLHENELLNRSFWDWKKRAPCEDEVEVMINGRQCVVNFSKMEYHPLTRGDHSSSAVETIKLRRLNGL